VKTRKTKLTIRIIIFEIPKAQPQNERGFNNTLNAKATMQPEQLVALLQLK